MKKSKAKRSVRRWDKTFPKVKVSPPDSPSPAPASLPLPDAGHSPAAPLPAIVGPSLTPEERLARLPQCPKCGTRYLRKRDTCSVCGEWSPEKLAIDPNYRMSDDSIVRTHALKIVAMRAAGITDDQIAVALKLSKQTISGYLYKAGKNGWLNFDDPKDSLEYQVLHKVVRNLDELLDSADEKTKQEVTLKTAEGTLFKKFGVDSNANQAPQTIVGVKVEIVGGTTQTVREGTVMGSGKYLDAEPVE